MAWAPMLWFRALSKISEAAAVGDTQRGGGFVAESDKEPQPRNLTEEGIGEVRARAVRRPVAPARSGGSQPGSSSC